MIVGVSWPRASSLPWLSVRSYSRGSPKPFSWTRN